MQMVELCVFIARGGPAGGGDGHRLPFVIVIHVLSRQGTLRQLLKAGLSADRLFATGGGGAFLTGHPRSRAVDQRIRARGSGRLSGELYHIDRPPGRAEGTASNVGTDTEATM